MRKISFGVVRGIAVGAVLTVAAAQMFAADFVKPTKEELAMTSLPGYPGAAAVVLNEEEATRDDLHAHQYYRRIKILTEKGKDYANVELRSVSFAGDYRTDYESMNEEVTDIQGRTIHPDGTIIPFTGKPYLKTIEKTQGVKFQEKVFTLPDAEVGSIIEYRYALRYSDAFYQPPDWYIQGDLYVKQAHFVWYPTTREMVDGETQEPINTITWFPILPVGVTITHHDLPGQSPNGATPQIYELTIKDVPPALHEDYMPPIASFTYRVLYNFSQYRSFAEYWKSEGKKWSKRMDKFAGPNSDLTAATQPIIAGASTQDEKLRKIYAAIMKMDNTDYSREHERQEDKAEGLGKVDNSYDVLMHKRGSGSQLTKLFVGMARAAGMKAYFMAVPDRSERLFVSGWMNFNQFDDLLAIVNVDGKEQFFDPGTRYCAYGSLPWQETISQGIRQTDSGTDFARTPIEPYSANKVNRAAEIAMAEDGKITGTIDVTYTGDPALHWREVALKGDEESVRHQLRETMEELLPKTMEVRVKDVKNLEDYNQPLEVSYEVKGTLGTATGKRLVVPAELFMSGSTATFPHDKRELAVYFHYPEAVQDAWRLRFPSSYVLEGTPDAAKYEMKGTAAYSMAVVPAATNVIVRRSYARNGIIFPVDHYADLRAFYSQFEAKDHESLVLKPATPTASAAPAGN